MYFQRRCRFKFFLPYGPILTKTKKIINNQKRKIVKNKWSGDMEKGQIWH